MQTIIHNNPDNMIDADSRDMPNGYKYVVKRGNMAAAFDLRKYMHVVRDEIKENVFGNGLFKPFRHEYTHFIEYELNQRELFEAVENAFANIN